MNPVEVDWHYFLQFFKNRAKTIVIILSGTLIFFSLLFLILPKKFKSASQITIYARYFQNPLIKDFISEQYDPSEMKTQRESIIQQALNDDFLDRVGTEFKLFRKALSDPKHGSEREDFRKHFEVFSLSSESYQIGFIWDKPQIAQDVAKETTDEVIQTLVSQRRKTITNVRNAIRARMESMVLFKNTGLKSLGSSSRAQIEAQLEQIRAQIHSLLQQYTERHPKVLQLRAREQILQKYLKNNSSISPPLAREARESDDLPPLRSAPETLSGSSIDSGSKEVYQDLFRKYNYLNVAIDMEKADDVNYYALVSAPSLPLSPVSPKFLNFLGYGSGAGLLLSLFWLLFDELTYFNLLNAERRAKWWGIPLLGVLPSFRQGADEVNIPPAVTDGKQPNDWN